MLELLLILVGLTTFSMLIMSLTALAGGSRKRAMSLLFRCLTVAATYFSLLVVVSLTSPQRILSTGQDWCFDDWCVAVENVDCVSEIGPSDDTTNSKGIFYVVRLRLSNHGRGRDQRAGSAAVFLLDGLGNRYDVSSEGQSAYEAVHGPALPLTVTIPYGQSVNTVRIFDVPEDAQEVGLTVQHPVGFSPGYFVIGDPSSLLHKRTVIRLN